jgi:tRNA A64-2'-O-ribosylphosphate transferase
MAQLTTADLIFSEQANHNFSHLLGELKRSTLSIHNRLKSVLTDARFVEHVQQAYKRPLVANERCGSWYIDPARKGGSAYFKSTDGHTGVWKFSTRRLNVHLLELIGADDGIIIVDSTRRGKRMPDALSKTIPIWCAVLNRALFPSNLDCHKLYTPPQVVSDQENAQISGRLPEFLGSFLALGLDLDALRGKIQKPLRPFWVTPDSDLDGVDAQVFEEYHPVICCTCSRRVAGAEATEGGYIQGSGDDTENWAHGLTPPVFWANKEELLTTPEGDLPELIKRLVAEAEPLAAKQLIPVHPRASIYVMTNSTLEQQPARDKAVIVHFTDSTTKPDTWEVSPRELAPGLGSGKLASKNLRAALPTIITFLLPAIARVWDADGEKAPIYLSDPDGKDVAVGVALVLLCLLYNDSGIMLPPSEWRKKGDRSIDKTFIRERLAWIMTSLPDANPSRNTLQSVNTYLMSRE